MSETKSRVITLRGGPPVINEDDKAVAAITPGHLVTYSGAGLVKHATAGGEAARTFALERDEMGNDIDVAYASGDVVKVGSFHQGQQVNALCASGQNLAKGAFLESDGAGRVRVYASGVILARTTKAVDNSAGPGDARVAVEII